MKTIVRDFREKLEHEKFKRVPKPSQYKNFRTVLKVCKNYKDTDFRVLAVSNHAQGKTTIYNYLKTMFS